MKRKSQRKNVSGKQLKPEIYRVIYKVFDVKCKYFVPCEETSLFGMCIKKEIFDLMPHNAHVNELGITCGKTCPFFVSGQKDKIHWVKKEEVRRNTKPLEFWYGDSKPKPNSVVLAFNFSTKKWIKTTFPIAKLFKMPYRKIQNV